MTQRQHPGWHVLTIRPGAGEAVYRRLEADGYELWRPMHQCWRQRRGSRRREYVWRPCLPAYLFIALTPQIWAAQRISGVTGLIMCGSEPAIIPDKALDPMRRKIADGTADQATQVRQLVVGAMLEILEGPFANMSGTLDGTDGRQTVHIVSTKWPGRLTTHIANVRVLG